MRKRIYGFTLIELVVVIIILGILANIAAQKFISVSENANTSMVKGTAAALTDAIRHAHLYWEVHASGEAVGDLVGFQDGSYNFNEFGFPVESDDKKRNAANGYSNGATTPPNHNRCGRLWNNLLSHITPLDRSGIGDKVAGETDWYYSIEGGTFKLVTAAGGLCEYELMADSTTKIQYNVTNGEVRILP